MSEQVVRLIGEAGRGGIVAVCDHASNRVPEGIELGVSPDTLDKHVAYDIGAGGVCERLARRHNIPAMLSDISRLVIDMHREEDADGLVPTSSDGILIAGNIGADREARLERYYRPYHDALESWLDAVQPGLILSIHSFTPVLESDPAADRPWEIGLLYNQDDSAAQHAIRLFSELGVTVGDNEPYSGKQLNAAMNRHAEAHGRPYCAIEIRNDLIATETGQARWAAIIADVAGRVKLALESAA
ncbi:N-formylglutamate amidohydrolase [Aurantiacibacter gangjinensis]|uniref:N-formylglutamate amidohydrolase n=1 Tax=Aurantiacibacter gangjinensis TaxID=502682 RepID=A0A0G9MUM1_9SPHN|nr:N-formylglutamate amidohydrolase [Aurantiacibacter gangjinensis]APE28886.1 N-formylglutamate amidohydrolase [Aurantiacibacter gangjinensis]KLE33018.1 N-formylglutamate amidohydrolase [Aurantiacibacter gangjinensis]